MKNLLSLFLVFSGLMGVSQQCVRSADITATDVQISGMASLVHDGESLIVRLSSDFQTEAGPDLDVYLSDEPNPVVTGVRLDRLMSFTGAQDYIVPSNISINDFKYVSVHCTQYNHLFGYALLGEASGDCSGALTSPELIVEGVKITNHGNIIRVDGFSEGDEQFKTEIFNQSGQLLLSSLNPVTRFEVDTVGLYLVKISYKGKVRTEKILFQ